MNSLHMDWNWALYLAVSYLHTRTPQSYARSSPVHQHNYRLSCHMGCRCIHLESSVPTPRYRPDLNRQEQTRTDKIGWSKEQRRNNTDVINATFHTPVQKYLPAACASLSTSRGQNSRTIYLLGCFTKLKCIPTAKSIAQFKIGKINYLLV